MWRPWYRIPGGAEDGTTHRYKPMRSKISIGHHDDGGELYTGCDPGVRPYPYSQDHSHYLLLSRKHGWLNADCL